jgi:choline dehydrogenase-like flavoprotein
VIASELQQAGRSVIVLERGGYRNEADFRQLDLVGARELYLRGGPFYSASATLRATRTGPLSSVAPRA